MRWHQRSVGAERRRIEKKDKYRHISVVDAQTTGSTSLQCKTKLCLSRTDASQYTDICEAVVWLNDT